MSDQAPNGNGNQPAPETVNRQEFQAAISQLGHHVDTLAEAVRAESAARGQSIKDLTDLMRDETKSRSRDHANLRSDILGVANKSADEISELSGKQGKPQYQALGLGLTLTGLLLTAFAGMYVWGEARLQDERDRGRDKEAARVTSLESHRHADDMDKRDAAKIFAQFSERFKEVETQFDGLRDTTTLSSNDLARRIDVMETEGNPRHDERILELQRRVELIEVAHRGRPEN